MYMIYIDVFSSLNKVNLNQKSTIPAIYRRLLFVLLRVTILWISWLNFFYSKCIFFLPGKVEIRKNPISYLLTSPGVLTILIEPSGGEDETLFPPDLLPPTTGEEPHCLCSKKLSKCCLALSRCGIRWNKSA